jgi:uroporphyrinogen-III synthase
VTAVTVGGAGLVGAPPDGVAPLAGFTVAVTAVRRAGELTEMLVRRGADVLAAPALRMVPLVDDSQLFAATRALLADPPDVVLVTTGGGFTSWLSAAASWGLAEGLLDRLRRATLVARGPRAAAAITEAATPAAGAGGLPAGGRLRVAFVPESESVDEAVAYLVERGVAGKRVAVQLHGEAPAGVLAALAGAGAQVVELPVCRWLPPVDLRPLDALLDGALAGTVDAVTFTSAAAVSNVLARAGSRGLGTELLKRLCSNVLAACVGPVTAAELTRRQVPTVQPDRYRLGGMVRLLSVALQSRARRIEVAGNELEIRGHAVLVNGRLRPVPPSGMALLRVMGNRPGVVVPRQVLLRALPGGTDDEHAVEAAVARLRGALGEPRLIQTVVKRGYRLATDPRAGSRVRRLMGEPAQARTVVDSGRSAEEPPARIV